MGIVGVKFYENIEDSLIYFSVIITKYKDKLVFCKHKQRDTFEIPGGHREEGETHLQTAKRELMEETGAIDFDIKPICVYAVVREDENKNQTERCGMLYFANVKSFGKIDSEIEKIEFFDDMPNNMTYSLIQPLMIQEAKRRKII